MVRKRGNEYDVIDGLSRQILNPHGMKKTVKTKPKKLDRRVKKMADKLRQMRKESGYTSGETFAFDKELPRVQYWRMEHGVNFRIETLLKVLDVHKVSLEHFFSGIK